MEKQTFKTLIDAPREKVWSILFGETSYPVWTAVFAEGSQVETDWKEGSKAIFHDGSNTGMVSVIARNIPNEFLSIKHLGMIKDGVEDFESDEVKKWAGGFENYTLAANGTKTELIIDMDMTEEIKKYMMDTWPSALEKVKELSEEKTELVS